MLKLNTLWCIALLSLISICISSEASACTGISLKAQDGSKVIARTFDWGPFPFNSVYVIVPRGRRMTALASSGMQGIRYVSKYGFVGISALEENFIFEGMNEAGLVAEIFYFPENGSYEEVSEEHLSSTLYEAELAGWILSRFATIEEMVLELPNIHVVGLGQGFDISHWSVADTTGRQVVIEVVDRRLVVHENRIGVIANAPSFHWHMKNLNNYAHVFAGSPRSPEICPGVVLEVTDVRQASLGLPGDCTAAARFVRAAFYKMTARPQSNGRKAVLQAFQILNSFDLPIGVEFAFCDSAPDYLSATQWTSACDQKHLTFYYRTGWNCTLRCIDMKTIDFDTVDYQTGPLDRVAQQPVEYIRVR